MIVQLPQAADEVQAVKRPSSTKWKRTRFAVWLRDDFRCVFCGLDFLRDYQSLHLASVDHVKPRVKGGSNDMENLVSCCTSCNCLKADSEIESLEEGRELIAVRRSMLMGQFVELAREYGIQFPRDIDGPTAQAMAAFDTANSLKAFTYHAERLSKEIRDVGGRVTRINRNLSTLSFFHELFETPEESSPEELTAFPQTLPGEEVRSDG
jgi:molybdopterin/thiamine biosynthesis adenylyltransferase